MKNSFVLMVLVLSFGIAGCNNGSGVAVQPPAPAQENEAGQPERVELSIEAQQGGGIKTEVLKPVSVMETFHALGRVMQDAQKSFHTTAGRPGRVEQVSVALGQKLKPGDELAVIRAVSGERVRVVAEHGGIVTAMHVMEGEQVNELTFLATITDVDPLWGVLDIPERNLGLVRKGQAVEIRTEAYRDRAFFGKVHFISPEVDSASRTVKVRVAIDNESGLLKFGMFLDCRIRTGEYFSGLAVRADAVQNRKEGQFVFVKTGETVFELRAVETGREKDGLVEIKKGVAKGEVVATQGAYLLKSEMMKSLLGED